MSLGHGASIVKNGLVLHLDAANSKSYPGTGTAWNDLSGNGNNGTLVNGVGYSSDNRGSFVFDGVNDFCISTATWGDIKGSNWNGQITMEAVIKTNVTPTNSLMGYVGFNSANGFFKILNSSNLFLDALSTAQSRVITSVIAGTTFFGNWVHVCAVYDGTVKTYYNGVLQNISAAFTLADISSLNFNVGFGGGYFNFQGNIPTTKLYNRALTAAEVQQNFEASRGRYGI